MVQRAGIAALRSDQTFLEEARARFQRRRDLFVNGLNGTGSLDSKRKGRLFRIERHPGQGAVE